MVPFGDGAAAALSVVIVSRGLHLSGYLAWAAVIWLGLLLALTWRAVWVLSTLAGGSPASIRASDGMIDRADPGAAAARTLLGTFAYGELLRNLVIKDLKLKYRGSVFGFLWSLVNPLIMIGVYATAFTYILRIRAEGFVFFLLLGILAWTFFANSAGMSTGAIVDSGGLVKSAVFPRAILPVATVFFNFAQYLLTIVVFLPLMLVAYRVVPVPAMALFPVFLSLQVLFTIGVALMLATGTAFFRDIRHFLEIALSVMFWTTPIVYRAQDLPPQVHAAILMSPLSPFVMAYQQMFYYQQWPEPAIWIMATLYAFASLTIGVRLFVAFEDRFAEQL